MKIKDMLKAFAMGFNYENIFQEEKKYLTRGHQSL